MSPTRRPDPYQVLAQKPPAEVLAQFKARASALEHQGAGMDPEEALRWYMWYRRAATPTAAEAVA